MTHLVPRAAISLIALTGAAYAMAFLRDASVAALYGAGSITDALFAGTTLPMMIYTVVLAGALGPAFLAVYGRSLGRATNNDGALVGAVARKAYFSSLVAVALIEVFAGQLVSVLAPGFDAEGAAQAALMLRLSAPMLILLAPCVLASAVLNLRGNFVIPGCGSLVFGATMFAAVPLSRSLGMALLPLSMVIGAGLQLCLLLLASDKETRRTLVRRWWVKTTGTVDYGKELVSLLLPALGYMAVAPVLLVVERAFASGFGAGALSQMAYAYKLYAVPLTVVAVSTASVLFPGMVAVGRSEDRSELGLRVERGLRQVTLLVAPVLAWLLASSGAFVSAVFQRGSFSAQDAVFTGSLLALYAPGLLPASYAMLLARACLASGERGSLLWSGGLQVVAYLAAVQLLPPGARSLAAAMSISSFAGCGALYLFSARRLGLRFGRLLTALWLPLRIAAASGAAAWLAVLIVGTRLGSAPVSIIAGIAAGCVLTVTFPAMHSRSMAQSQRPAAPAGEERLLWK